MFTRRVSARLRSCLGLAVAVGLSLGVVTSSMHDHAADHGSDVAVEMCVFAAGTSAVLGDLAPADLSPPDEITFREACFADAVPTHLLPLRPAARGPPVVASHMG